MFVDFSGRKVLLRIYGTERSGSTFLDYCLGSCHDAFSLGEINAWFLPYMKHHKSLTCSCGTDNCEVLRAISDLKLKGLYGEIFSKLGVSVLVDSSKEPYWYLRTEEKDPCYEIYNLVVYKEYKDFYRSFEKRGIEAKARKSYLSYYSGVTAILDNFVAIPYEELKGGSDGVVRKIFELIGVPAKEIDYSRAAHMFFGSATFHGGKKNKNKSVIHGDSSAVISPTKEISLIEKELKSRDFKMVTEVLPHNSFRKNISLLRFSIRYIVKKYLFKFGLYQKKITL